MERSLRARAAVTEVVASTLQSISAPAYAPVRLQETGAAELVDAVLQACLTTIGGDAAGLWEHVRHGWSVPLYVTPPDVWRRLPHRRTRTADAAQIHPGVRYCLEVRPTEPFTVSDLIDERTWQNSDIGRAMRRDWGRNHQLMLPVDTRSTGPTWWVWVLGRRHTDFAPADRDVAAAVLPVLTAVTRHIVAVQRLHVPTTIDGVLTDREQGVLSLLLEGQSAAQVAGRLDVSVRTVQKHVERIYRKLGVHDRHGLVATVTVLWPDGVGSAGAQG